MKESNDDSMPVYPEHRGSKWVLFCKACVGRVKHAIYRLRLRFKLMDYERSESDNSRLQRRL